MAPDPSPSETMKNADNPRVRTYGWREPLALSAADSGLSGCYTAFPGGLVGILQGPPPGRGP